MYVLEAGQWLNFLHLPPMLQASPSCWRPSVDAAPLTHLFALVPADDRSQPGSATAFIALHQAMVEVRVGGARGWVATGFPLSKVHRVWAQGQRLHVPARWRAVLCLLVSAPFPERLVHPALPTDPSAPPHAHPPHPGRVDGCVPPGCHACARAVPGGAAAAGRDADGRRLAGAWAGLSGCGYYKVAKSSSVA